MEQSHRARRTQGSRALAATTARAGGDGVVPPDRGAVAVLAGAPVPEPAGARSDGERPLVLVADDDPDVLDLVVDRMEGMGFEVLAARDGGEALRLAVERNPAIAILDVAMPRLDGLEVTRRLRSRDPADGVAVILMTARVADADVVRGFEAGAEEYIKKPFSVRELTEAVRRKQEQQALRRREAATRRMAGEQAALREVATAVAAEATPRQIFALVAEAAGTTLGADAAAVLRLGDVPGAARVVGAWAADGRPAPRLGGLLPVARDDDPLAALARTAAALLGGHEDPPVGVAPIRVGEQTWGAVALASGGAPFHPEVEECLPRFAELVGLTIANADARHQLTTLASVDGLTGLLNQRSFKERLVAEVRTARRRHRPLSLALLDIDHFKRVNDVYGHAVGDRVLAEVARRLKAAVRAGETVARIGGEEFAWVLPATDGANARAAAERARRAVSERPFPVVGTLTVSAGVCELGGEARDADELFRLADVALYWAKSRGRDRCTEYSGESARAASEAAERAGREREEALAGIRTLAALVDGKSPATRGHSERVAALAQQLALACGWTHDRAALLREVGLVHDVGKIAVPDEILLKPGALDEDERLQIRNHPVVGARMVAGLFTDEQAAWLRHHHERFAGGGYPDGLLGAGIPIGARLLAIADAWDAMTSERVYQTARTAAEALAECRREAGGHFCPQGVAALARLWEEGRIPGPGAGPVEGM
jgi:diguanylate cyclase (GGDEF)-like protein